MSKKLTIDKVKERIKEKHGDKVTLDEFTYVNTRTKCWFIDKDHGRWEALPKNIMRGHGHGGRGREKSRQTCVENYGVENPSQSEEIKEKKIQTNLKNHGVEHPMQDPEIREKHKQTCIENHGVEYPMQNPETQEKKIQTCVERFGVPHAMQNPEIALKCAKSQNNSFILIHWKTNEELVCVASYEKKTVEYFNENKIDFKWQSKTFTMPDGRTFRPDCYILGDNKWIEIKGYFHDDDAKEKWNWFSKKHPNSELWDEDKLKKLGIL